MLEDNMVAVRLLGRTTTDAEILPVKDSDNVRIGLPRGPGLPHTWCQPIERLDGVVDAHVVADIRYVFAGVKFGVFGDGPCAGTDGVLLLNLTRYGLVRVDLRRAWWRPSGSGCPRRRAWSFRGERSWFSLYQVEWHAMGPAQVTG